MDPVCWRTKQHTVGVQYRGRRCAGGPPRRAAVAVRAGPALPVGPAHVPRTPAPRRPVGEGPLLGASSCSCRAITAGRPWRARPPRCGATGALSSCLCAARTRTSGA
eukprot:scaffold180545_cov32-Tisochrysis_lutea.AAC.1